MPTSSSSFGLNALHSCCNHLPFMPVYIILELFFWITLISNSYFNIENTFRLCLLYPFLPNTVFFGNKAYRKVVMCFSLYVLYTFNLPLSLGNRFTPEFPMFNFHFHKANESPPVIFRTQQLFLDNRLQIYLLHFET